VCVLICRITFASAGCSASLGSAMAQGVTRGLLLQRCGFVPSSAHIKGALEQDSFSVNCFFHTNINKLAYTPVFVAFIASHKLRV
jgi:hypothetical protein